MEKSIYTREYAAVIRLLRQARREVQITQVQLAHFLRCDVVTARQIVTECLTSTDVAADGHLETLHLDEFQKSLLSSAS